MATEVSRGRLAQTSGNRTPKLARTCLLIDFSTDRLQTDQFISKKKRECLIQELLNNLRALQNPDSSF